MTKDTHSNEHALRDGPVSEDELVEAISHIIIQWEQDRHAD